ncbi:unnamed protein product, partial [Umbelopsis ramanniana]
TKFATFKPTALKLALRKIRKFIYDDFSERLQSGNGKASESIHFPLWLGFPYSAEKQPETFTSIHFLGSCRLMDVGLQSLSNLLSNRFSINDLVAYACEENASLQRYLHYNGTLVTKDSGGQNPRSNVLPQSERKEALPRRIFIKPSRRRSDVNKLLTRNTVFADIQRTIQITSADAGESGSRMLKRHTQDGENDFPELSWNTVDGVAEYILICEDPDAPLSDPIVHGLFCEIPASTATLNPLISRSLKRVHTC